jgi:hypothetical protein
MSQIAHTTKIYRKGATSKADLDTEVMALVKRVSDKLKPPTPTTPQDTVEDEYEPQDVVTKAKGQKNQAVIRL